MLNRTGYETRLRIVIPIAGLCLLFSGCGHDPAGQLITELGDSDAAVRRIAARKLGLRAVVEARVVAALAKAAEDSDAGVRFDAITSLRRIGPAASAALPSLANALHDSDPRVSVRTAFAIQKIDPENKDFVPVLIQAMRGGDGRTIREVGALGAEAAWAVPTLIELLSYEAPQMRAVAAQTLGRIGPGAAKSKAALERASQDSNVAVRGAAERALRQIGENKAKT